MECIVHFEVISSQGMKELRGLVFVEKGQLPSEADLLSMFEGMGYKLRLEDPDNLIFKPVESNLGYERVRIRKLDTGENHGKEDKELKSLVANLLPNPSRPI